MAVFKSKAHKQFERDVEVKRGIGLLKKQIASLNESQITFLDKAREAKLKMALPQYELARSAVKRTLSQKRLLERQLLTIEIAAQMKEMARSQKQFIASLNAISKSITSAFGEFDLVRSQVAFEKAMSKAASMEERVELFLEAASGSMATASGESCGDLVSDQELDSLIEEAAAAQPMDSRADEEIRQGLQRVKEALGKEERG